MRLNWHKSESTAYPDLIDTFSSKTTVYLRKNVVEVQREDITFYQYDECKLTKAEYRQYLQEMSIINLEQMRADIDYISFMVDVPL